MLRCSGKNGIYEGITKKTGNFDEKSENFTGGKKVIVGKNTKSFWIGEKCNKCKKEKHCYSEITEYGKCLKGYSFIESKGGAK
jgi:ribosomal protein S27E